MRVAFPPILALLLLQACTSPQERLQKIESGMLGLLGPAADLKVSARNGPYQLPLPPPLDVQAEQKSQAQKLLAEASKIDTADLDPQKRRHLRAYQRILTDLSGSTSGWPLDPLDYTLAGLLQTFLTTGNEDSLAELLEKTADYYTEVEQRWRSSNPQHLAAAVTQGLAALDRLAELESNLGKYPPAMQARLRAALPAARAGMKNYLGLCRSGVLE